MRYAVPSFILLLSVGCGHTGQEGDTDAATDSTDPLVPDGACGSCDDSNPCTMDWCNSETLECVFLPLDADLDGQIPIECGGDDCDDADPDVYAGAPEVCLDGVDQDCDTLTDGPIPMIPELRVTEPTPQERDPEMVWTGSEYVLTWSAMESERGLFVTRIGADGERIGDHVLVEEDEIPEPGASLVWTGSSLALAWEHRDTLTYARLGPTGDLEVAPRHVRFSEDPVMAWTGSEFGIAWHEPDWILLVTLDIDGEITTGDTPVLVADGVDLGWPDVPAMAWTGSEFFLAWIEYFRVDDYPYFDLFTARVSAEAEVVADPLMITDSGMSWEPSLVWTGSAIGMVWNAGYYDVYFAQMSPSGSVIDRIRRASDMETLSLMPDITWTGSEFGLAWASGPEEHQSVSFALLDAEGDRRFEVLHVMGVRTFVQNPAIVWSGSEFGVAWNDGRNDEDCVDDVHGDCITEVFFTRIGLCD